MKKTRILSAALIAAALVGCSQEEQFDMFQEGQMEFIGSFEQANSRVTMDTENYMMHWEEDCSDLVSIFPGITVNNKYQVSGINNGKASFAFVDYYFPEGATYQKTSPKLNYALYPYADGNSITTGGTITAQLPSELTYVSHENSIKTALMTAKSEGNDLNFKNVQGILRLRLDAELPFFKVKSITLKSTKALSGEATIVFDAEDLPKVTLAENGGKTLTINLSENLQQCLKGTTSGEYSEFYIPVVPALYAQGELQMIIDWVDQDVAEYVHPIRIPVNIERRKIYTLYITVPANGFGGNLEGAEEVWDGETITIPTPVSDDTTGETYYPITKASELAGFAAMVNGTATLGRSVTTPETMNFKLEGNIDLGGYEWTPIGTFTNCFMGNFDGNGYKIMNLKISEIALDSDGYAYAGLFGITEGTEDNPNSIKNLTIENVNIQTEGHIVAAAIAYPYYTTVENITVTGNVNIKGGDYTAGVLAYTRRCVDAKDLTIAGNAGSSIEGNITVGGVISDIQMNGGLTANYSNFAASGLTIKGAMSVGGISGIITKQTLDGATVKNVNIICEDNRTGIVSGALGEKSTITNVSYENVTGATRVIGATWKEGYYIGQIVECAGKKAIIYSIEDGVKAVSVEELNLKGKNLSDATTWATSLGEGWALASIEELDAIHAARKTLNVALAADNTENALFCEADYYVDDKYAMYLSSTEATGTDPQGEAYFANRVHLKYFNLNGYWDYPLSTFATINKSAPLKDNYFARAVYTF